MTRQDNLYKRDPPRLNCQDCVKTSRNASVSINGKNGEILLRTWTKRHILPSCGELCNGINARAKRMAENEAITFNGISFSSSKQLAAKFNKQFNTSKLGRHSSSRETRLVTRQTKRKLMEMAETFAEDIVTRSIKICRNSKAFSPAKLSIFYLKNLGTRAIEYVTAFFNLHVTNFQIPAIWKSSLTIPIHKPGKDTSKGSPYRPISLLCPALKVLETLILPTINTYLLPAHDQHGVRQEHSTTSALLQLSTEITMGFNQRKPHDRTVCVVVDLSVVFDTVCHNKVLSKINRSHLPPATSRWLSCYLRRRQAKTCFRGVKSPSRKISTGLP